MIVGHLKQSGEKLTTDGSGELWTPDALRRSAEQIGEVQRNMGRLVLHGLMVVPGAGNIVRGRNVYDSLPEGSQVHRRADVVGRLGTVMNAAMLSAALDDEKVPHVMLMAPGMGYADPHVGTIDAYCPEAAMEAYRRERVVVIAGGSGKDKQTTDAAVMDYTLLESATFPEMESIALKTTKFPGIYTEDPAKHPQAKRYKTIAAADMLAMGLGGVDEQCLRLIQQASDVQLFVYADATPFDALDSMKAMREGHTAAVAGTIITSGTIPATLAEPGAA